MFSTILLNTMLCSITYAISRLMRQQIDLISFLIRSITNTEFFNHKTLWISKYRKTCIHVWYILYPPKSKYAFTLMI